MYRSELVVSVAAFRSSLIKHSLVVVLLQSERSREESASKNLQRELLLSDLLSVFEVYSPRLLAVPDVRLRASVASAQRALM